MIAGVFLLIYPVKYLQCMFSLHLHWLSHVYVLFGPDWIKTSFWKMPEHLFMNASKVVPKNMITRHMAYLGRSGDAHMHQSLLVRVMVNHMLGMYTSYGICSRFVFALLSCGCRIFSNVRTIKIHQYHSVSLKKWQLCRHWWHRKLSMWQLTLPSVTTKLSDWQYFVFSGCCNSTSTTLPLSQCQWREPERQR